MDQWYKVYVDNNLEISSKVPVINCRTIINNKLELISVKGTNSLSFFVTSEKCNEKTFI